MVMPQAGFSFLMVSLDFFEGMRKMNNLSGVVGGDCLHTFYPL
jgi:hypothetical protein